MSNLSEFAKAMQRQVNGQRGGIKAAAKTNILQAAYLTPFKKEKNDGKTTQTSRSAG